MSGAKAQVRLPEPSGALAWFNTILCLLLIFTISFPIFSLYLWIFDRTKINFSIARGVPGWLGIALWIGYIYGLFSLRSVIGAATRGDIFTSENVLCLHRIAWLIFIYAFLVHIYSPLLASSNVTTSVRFQIGTNTFLNWFTASLAVFAIAEVFRQGVVIRQEELRLRQEETRLREEQELTV